MKILYVCGHDPHDASFGGAQRTQLLWKALKQVGDVYTVCYYPQEGRISDHITAINIIRPRGRRSLLNRTIRRIWDRFDLEGKKLLPVADEFSISEPYPGVKFDVVVCRYCEPAAIFHLWNIAPLYIDVDDHPLQAFDTRDCLALKAWQRPIASMLQRLEFRILEHYTTGGWIANPEQTSWCHFKKPAIALKNIPQFPSQSYCADAKREKYIFSIGFMQYQPNYMGVQSFLDEVWPRVYAEFPNLMYYIGGKNAPKACVDRWNAIPGVKYIGFVDDLEALYAQSLATVVAVDQGSGTCIKTLESMAYSRICLSRPFGTRGLESEATNGKNGLYVFHDAEEFVSLLKNKVYNTKIREVQEQNAKTFINKFYSEQAFVESVKEAFI